MSPIGPGNMKPILWIWAGNVNEYEYHAREIWTHFGSKEACPYDVRYINEAQKIRGYRDCVYICYGRWYGRSDYDIEETKAIMNHANFKELGHSDIFGVDEKYNSYGYDIEMEHRALGGHVTGDFFTEEEFDI